MSNNKIAIFTHLDKNFKRIEDIVRDNHLAYSRANKHEYIKLLTDEIVDHELINKEIYWVKLMGALDILNKRKDIEWLFMIDLDIVFNQMNIPLSFFTKCANSKQEILMCAMGNSMIARYWDVNIGAIFFKNTEYVRNFLRFFLDVGKSRTFTYLEQPVLHELLQTNQMSMLDKVGFFPEHAFNHGGSETFLYHACGPSTSTMNFEEAINRKIEILTKILSEKAFENGNLYVK
jgi:hypothetical protein